MPELNRVTAWLAAASLLGLGTACATPAAPAQPAAAANPTARVAVVKSLGGRQCESTGSTPAALAQSLRQAGLTVLSESCAHDGRMRAAVCGGPDGVLALFELPADQLSQAQSLGFVALAGLPDARRQPCR